MNLYNMIKLDQIVSDCVELYGVGSVETKTELNGISTYLQQIDDKVNRPEIREKGFHVLNKRR